MVFFFHAVSSDSIKVDPKKNKVVRNWLRTLFSLDIRSLLGLVLYYHRFVEEFSFIVASFTKITQKSVKF